jgi:hypothetical protein
MPRGIVAGEIHRRLAHALAPIDRHMTACSGQAHQEARKMDALSTLDTSPPSLPNPPAIARPDRVAPKGRQSTFQVELVAQPIGNGLDHLATIRILLRPVPHDRDFP